jgi:CheY-like chemotaxis protein
VTDGTYVLLEVADEGVGMDAATLERFGEPFYSTKFPGRGLGLAVVCGVVASHDCHLTVESAPGEGSTFRVYFSAVGGADAAAIPPVPVAAHEEWTAMAGFTVLLVDDEEEVRNIGGRMLEQLGCEVIAVDSGRGALDLLAGEGPRPDAVLLDATMPGLSGVDTLREIRACEPDLSVIMTSGHPREAVLAPASGIVPDAFLGKPYFIENLARTLDEVRLRRRA